MRLGNEIVGWIMVGAFGLLPLCCFLMVGAWLKWADDRDEEDRRNRP